MIESILKASAKQRMRYHALACDYDGTLATQGMVDLSTLQALKRVGESGRKLLLITGRRLEDLFEIFHNADIFDYIVAENGAVLYKPATKVAKLLAKVAPKLLIQELKKKDVTPLEVGHALIATWHPNETTVIDTIQELGLDWQITFNKGAVMILPPGVNKLSGMNAALTELGISRHNVVGVGDAENDLVFLEGCEMAVAVSNALPALKSSVDLVTKADHGAGVIEVIERLIKDDLEEIDHLIHRHDIVLGTAHDGAEVKFRPYDTAVLIAGPSQSGKSTASMTMLEHLSAAGYQYCIIDPEGDYERAPRAVTIGNRHFPPECDDVLRALENSDENVVVNLLGLSFAERPRFFANIFPKLQRMRKAVGRPHWIVIDEAHHMLHPYWDQTLEPVWEQERSFALITVDPREISPLVLPSVDLVLSVGNEPYRTLGEFASAIGQSVPQHKEITLGWGEALAWFRHEYGKPKRVSIVNSPADLRRHMRKYVDGDVGADRSFYFTGPRGQLKLRAQNLFIFMQIGEGVDDETWLHHLRNGDYANWFRWVINDPILADQMNQLEIQPDLTADESRARVRRLIEKRYTLPVRFLI